VIKLLSRPTAVREKMNLRLLATAVEKFGNRDIVFAHEGIATAALAGKTSLATFEQVLRTNLTGVFFTIRAAAPETDQQVPWRQS
jgi:NAD(P)-dependent dehydrogenase (short-subunit alcohol dehydrogenase family)